MKKSLKNLKLHFFLITLAVNLMRIEAQQKNTTCKVDIRSPSLLAFDIDNNEIYSEGDDVENFVEIRYKCRKNFSLDGSGTNVCIEGIWARPHPRCLRHCSNADIIATTTKATCNYEGHQISCNTPLKSGTRATISCQIGYTLPRKRVTEIIVCNEDGKWSNQPFSCDPVCGTEPIETQPLILNGDRPNTKTIPWHAAIYSIRSNHYDYICGGTIITERIIITAAHCFWNFAKDQKQDKSLFTVAVGKYYSKIDANEQIPSQFFNLTELFIPPQFQHILSNFRSNFALVVVDKIIEFNMFVKPVCIEWQTYERQTIESNVTGRVAGWGFTEKSMPSDELLVANLPTISQSDCVEKVNSSLKSYITDDSFCLNTNGLQNVCQGDSGGGFVIPKTYGGIKFYYLWGIVSNSVGITNCDNPNFIVKMINIQSYSTIINHYRTKYIVK